MKNITISIGLIFFTLCVFAQSEGGNVQLIRDRYYRITGDDVKFQVLKYDNVEYYLENNKLAIIKVSERDGRYEFYFDFDKNRRNGLYAYFAYFESAIPEMPNLRAYYTQGLNLIRYMEDKEIMEISMYKRPDNKIALKCVNSLNAFLNICSENLNIYTKELAELGKNLNRIEHENDMSLPDTVKNYLNEDEGYDSHVILHYKDKKGNIFKKVSTSISDHSWTEEIDILMDGQTIYNVVKNQVTFQTTSKTITETYYYRSIRIKTVEYDNHDIWIEDFDFSEFIPKIQFE
ncbi:MAG: hypothetical protein ABFS12_17915 [Bacteroidota bacterium]